jgi:hypothetical protein
MEVESKPKSWSPVSLVRFFNKSVILVLGSSFLPLESTGAFKSLAPNDSDVFLKPHQSLILSCSFSDDGKYFLTSAVWILKVSAISLMF